MEPQIKAAIAEAEGQGQFLDEGAFSRVRKYIQKAESRVRAATYLADNAKRLIDAAVDTLSIPEASSPFKSKKTTGFWFKSIDLCLRMVQYCLMAGSTEPLESIAYGNTADLFFGLSPSLIVKSLSNIQTQVVDDPNLERESAEQARYYFQGVLDLLSLSEANEPTASQSLEPKEANPAGLEVPFWRRIASIGAQIPNEAWENLPKDMSRNGDHYLYGTPKGE